MNVDGAFILAESRRKNLVLNFIDSRFINEFCTVLSRTVLNIFTLADVFLH